MCKSVKKTQWKATKVNDVYSDILTQMKGFYLFRCFHCSAYDIRSMLYNVQTSVLPFAFRYGSMCIRNCISVPVSAEKAGVHLCWGYLFGTFWFWTYDVSFSKYSFVYWCIGKVWLWVTIRYENSPNKLYLQPRPLSGL